jgi:hypothetical protein
MGTLWLAAWRSENTRLTHFFKNRNVRMMFFLISLVVMRAILLIEVLPHRINHLTCTHISALGRGTLET